jgi:gliding motility-associated lipoprotein GldH
MRSLYCSLCIVGCLLLICSCGQKKIYEKEYDIANQSWQYKDTLDFSFDIKDTLQIYDIVLHVKHKTSYPFQNMYAKISTAFPNGKRIEQVLSIELAEPSGKWNGDANSEHSDFHLAIQPDAYFNLAGKHTITLAQFMRVDSLKGIEKIGLAIEETGKKRK